MTRGELFFVIGFSAVLFCGAFAFDSASCHARWQKSGFETSWDPMQGCVINVKGQWIPENRYREIP